MPYERAEAVEAAVDQHWTDVLAALRCCGAHAALSALTNARATEEN